MHARVQSGVSAASWQAVGAGSAGTSGRTATPEASEDEVVVQSPRMSPSGRWIPAVVTLVGAVFCLREALRYDDYQREELVATVLQAYDLQAEARAERIHTAELAARTRGKAPDGPPAPDREPDPKPDPEPDPEPDPDP